LGGWQAGSVQFEIVDRRHYIAADDLDQQAIRLALDMIYLVRGKGPLMTAVRTPEGVAGHHRLVLANHFPLAGSTIEPDTDPLFAVRKRDLWDYFHRSHPLFGESPGDRWSCYWLGTKSGQRLTAYKVFRKQK
jgi:hypothetical protein